MVNIYNDEKCQSQLTQGSADLRSKLIAILRMDAQNMRVLLTRDGKT